MPGEEVAEENDPSHADITLVEQYDCPPIHAEIGDGYNSQDFHLSRDTARSLHRQLSEVLESDD